MVDHQIREQTPITRPITELYFLSRINAEIITGMCPIVAATNGIGIVPRIVKLKTISMAVKTARIARFDISDKGFLIYFFTKHLPFLTDFKKWVT